MDILLYDKPRRIEAVGTNLFVDGNQHPKSVRTLLQMKRTMLKYREEAANLEMYFMFRNVFKAEDTRFDITMIPPLEISGECAKTHGHYHPGSEEGPAYPEVYQVLSGTGVFVLQKKNRSGSVDAMLVHARARDVVLLPPGWGHVSVNSGEDMLVLSNLVYDRFESIYDEYDENQGAALYYMKDGEIIQNTNYIINRSENISAKELNERYGFASEDLLAEFMADPHRFAFLQKPKILFKS
ncbi:MAG TPA: glucose-6-phosphate isomerase family protein [Candidatus Bilamarchaeum sp.]|nr:glucose-6-phosphate isomerase family protein [Candidatus Bilamarchaeum sp.]